MADKKRRKRGQLPPGVKGPQPQPAQQRPPARPSSNPPAGPSGNTQPSNLQRASIPLLTRLLALPRWLIVVAMGVFLFLGLIQTGNLAWLGGIFLLIVGGFLGWLLALSWPVLSVGRRSTRLIVVLAVLGIAGLKFLGRF
jgi:hypothetical protein